MKKLRLFFFLCPLLLAGCGNQAQDGRILVYASCYPVYDLVKRVAGDNVNVQCLVSQGEPHEYHPSAKDIANMSDAKAIFLNGYGMESWYDFINTDFPSKEAEAIKANSRFLSDGIATLKIDDITDPHLWLDPTKAIQMMENAAKSLTQIDQEHASQYAENLQKASLAFGALDLKAKAALEHLSNRYLVTSHAAFGYFAARYNLTQVALNGISPEDSPSPKEVEEVIATIRAYDVKTIYGEEMVSDSILSSIKEATGAEMKELYTIESRPEEGELDYIAMFESNIMTIQEGNR